MRLERHTDGCYRSDAADVQYPIAKRVYDLANACIGSTRCGIVGRCLIFPVWIIWVRPGVERTYGASAVSIPDPEHYVDSASDERTVNNTMRHQYRVLTEQEKEYMVAIKDNGDNFLAAINAMVPLGREASIAKTKIEEAVMWAVKGLTG